VRWLRIPLLTLLAIGLVACGDDDGAGPATTADAGAAVSVDTAAVTVTGEALPFFESVDGDEALGLTAPLLAGEDYDGNAVTMTADGRGRLVLFVVHWCPHCQAELPKVAEWLATGGLRDDVDLYVVSSAMNEERGNWPPSTWLRDADLGVPVIMDSESFDAAVAYGMSSFPYWVVVDPSGQVVFRISGELEPAMGVPAAEGFSQLADLAAGDPG
jgi:thiol-disulfide isomerase/thioredoxin